MALSEEELKIVLDEERPYDETPGFCTELIGVIRSLREKLSTAEGQRHEARAKCAELSDHLHWVELRASMLEACASSGCPKHSDIKELVRHLGIISDYAKSAQTGNPGQPLMDRLAALEYLIRKEWLFNHHCPTQAIYGDDGELQCNACRTDFKYMPFDELEKRVFELRARDAQKSWDVVEELRITKERVKALEAEKGVKP